MNDKEKDKMPRPKQIVGMDAHSRKIAISIWEWSSDPWNPVFIQQKSFDISELDKRYEELVDLDSLTILEASVNSSVIKRKLYDLGYRAEVVRADLIAGKEVKRKVCDSKDAENLAKAYMKGDVDQFVWVADEKHEQRRSIAAAFRDAKKEMQRNWNRIWSLCCSRGIRLPEETGKKFVTLVRTSLAGADLDPVLQERFDMLLQDYEYYMARYEKLDRMILDEVAQDETMIGLMQLPGLYYKSAYGIETVVEDINRFPKASKLSAYAGLAAQQNTSGEEEKRAERKGGSGKPLDPEGRRDLKYWFCEAGQTVLNTCKGSELAKWGVRLIFRGKPRNKVVCAVARKESVYAWHILHGEPTPNREGEPLFRRKMFRLAGDIGKKRLRELGFTSKASFAEYHAQRLYGHLPEKDVVTQNPSEKNV